MSKKYLVVSVIGLIGVVFLFIWILPTIELELDKKQYLEIMNNINQTKTKNNLRSLFDRDYNYTELLDWQHEKLVYTEEKIERYKDPFKILDYGKGKCQEFSILYAALCLAHGYQSRLVVDIYGDHIWTEIKLQNQYIHIDPTERKINDPYMYQRDWNKELKLVYAFKEDNYDDVTLNYKENI